jgi:hypothetical protein
MCLLTFTSSHPFLYFPSFYAIKAMVQGDSISTGFKNYRAEIKESMFALWRVWVPAMVRLSIL